MCTLHALPHICPQDLRDDNVEREVADFWLETDHIYDSTLTLRLLDEREESMAALTQLRESISVAVQLMHATEEAARAKEEGGMKSVLLEAQIKGKAKALAALKKGVFTLQQTLQNSVFAEQFIESDGL